MLAVSLIICASLVAEVPASRQFAQLFGDAVQAAGQVAGQAAGQVAGQVTHTLARYSEDFNMFPDKSKQAQRNFTLAEVRGCAGQGGGCLYVVYKGSVLDLTQFAPYHLGGSGVLLQHGGEDASAAMLSSGMPPQVYDVFLRRFVVGTLVPPAAASGSSATGRQTCGWTSLMGLCEFLMIISLFTIGKGLFV